MPPLPHWYHGIEAVTDFAVRVPLTRCPSWRHLPASANGQPTVAFHVGNDCIRPTPRLVDHSVDANRGPGTAPRRRCLDAGQDQQPGEGSLHRQHGGLQADAVAVKAECGLLECGGRGVADQFAEQRPAAAHAMTGAQHLPGLAGCWELPSAPHQPGPQQPAQPAGGPGAGGPRAPAARPHRPLAAPRSRRRPAVPPGHRDAVHPGSGAQPAGDLVALSLSPAAATG